MQPHEDSTENGFIFPRANGDTGRNFTGSCRKQLVADYKNFSRKERLGRNEAEAEMRTGKSRISDRSGTCSQRRGEKLEIC